MAFWTAWTKPQAVIRSPLRLTQVRMVGRDGEPGFHFSQRLDLPFLALSTRAKPIRQ
jgi:hypothetical protein